MSSHRRLPFYSLILPISALALSCSQESAPTAQASPANPAVALGASPATPPAKTISALTQLEEFVQPLTPEVNDMDLWEIFTIATQAQDGRILRGLGPMPPNTTAVFLADVRIIAERDLGLGRLTKETTTLEHIEAVLAHMRKTPAYELRGYRPRGHKSFLLRKGIDTPLAAEALAYLKEHGYEDPRDLELDARPNTPTVPPIVKAKWGKGKKLYLAGVGRIYGRLAWLVYEGEGSAWLPMSELDPILPEGPAPQETCSLTVGAKVKAPWSTTRTQLWPGEIVEIYAGMANIKFNDGNTGWAHCTREIKAL